MNVTARHTADTADQTFAARTLRLLSAALARAAVTGIPPCVLWPSPFTPMDDR